MCPAKYSLSSPQAYPDIQLSGEEAFRNSDRVEKGAGDVEAPHEDEPPDGHFVHRLVPPVDHAIMCGRRDAGQAEGYENPRAEGPESVGRSKPQTYAQTQMARSLTNNSFIIIREREMQSSSSALPLSASFPLQGKTRSYLTACYSP